MYAATRSNNAIALVDIASQRMLRRWFIQGHPVRLAVIPQSGNLLSTQVHTGDVALIALSNGAEIARMPIGNRVHGVAVDCTGEYAYNSAPASNIVVQVSIKNWRRGCIIRTSPGPEPVAILEPN